MNTLNYLFENSRGPGVFYNSSEGFTFIFDEFNITLNIKDKIDEEDLPEDYSLIKEISVIEDILQRYGLAKFQISYIENLSARPDCIWEEEDGLIYYDHLPKSVRNTILQVVREIGSFDKLIVQDYWFDVYDPSEGYCDIDGGNYAGYISLDPIKFSSDTLKSILKVLAKYPSTVIPCNYCVSFLREDKPRNVFQPQFVNTNTKSRRLGYLKVFFRFIDERQKISEAFVNKRFEDYALSFATQLSYAQNDKGLIVQSKGKSAEPYISLLRQFNLIITINRVVVPTKWSKTLMAMQVSKPYNENNIFELNDLDRLFFLETILREDFLYTELLLELIYIAGKTSYKELNDKFQGKLLLKLSRLERENYFGNQRSQDDLKVMSKRIGEWKNSTVYLEHIIMPILNWLLDLGLINMVKTQVNLTEEGTRLLENINFWKDISCADIANSLDYLDRYYPHLFAQTYRNNFGESIKRTDLVEKIKRNITESFNLFKTLAPNRVTSSQAITYSKYVLLLDENLVVSSKTHERILSSDLKDIFIFKFQPQYEDGYIQKIIH